MRCGMSFFSLSLPNQILFSLKFVEINHIFFLCSVAGTAGAVVTCPLEVVKTRLQSSNAFLPNPVHRSSRSSDLTGIQNSSTHSALRRPEQRRKFSSTILRRIRPQVLYWDCIIIIDLLLLLYFMNVTDFK